jgi:hypothetical protein
MFRSLEDFHKAVQESRQPENPFKNSRKRYHSHDGIEHALDSNSISNQTAEHRCEKSKLTLAKSHGPVIGSTPLSSSSILTTSLLTG